MSRIKFLRFDYINLLWFKLTINILNLSFCEVQFIKKPRISEAFQYYF